MLLSLELTQHVSSFNVLFSLISFSDLICFLLICFVALGEGKSTTTIGLAQALGAHTGRKVLSSIQTFPSHQHINS